MSRSPQALPLRGSPCSRSEELKLAWLFTRYFTKFITDTSNVTIVAMVVEREPI